MTEAELNQYRKLNELAERGGIVIFGCGADKDIPTGEIRQAFAVENKIYNRSFAKLTIGEAMRVYEQVVACLDPEAVLIHIGEDDVAAFAQDPAGFDNTYLALIRMIKAQNKNCRVAVVSLKNDENDPRIDTLNKHLKYIADSSECGYGNISVRKAWNRKAYKEAASFVYSVGFARPVKERRPLYDLVRMFFCYNT